MKVAANAHQHITHDMHCVGKGNLTWHEPYVVRQYTSLCSLLLFEDYLRSLGLRWPA